MRRDRLLVLEMIESAERAIALTEGRTLDQIENERDLRDALLWNYTILGEAAAQISDDLRSDRSDVEWSRPTALRNRIVHGYWSIDLEILHATAIDRLPAFVEQLREVLINLADDGRDSSGYSIS